jgi:hypothetical protein
MESSIIRLADLKDLGGTEPGICCGSLVKAGQSEYAGVHELQRGVTPCQIFVTNEKPGVVSGSKPTRGN